MDFKIFAPSYKRGEAVILHKRYDVTYVIHEENEKEYDGKPFIICPLPSGNVARVRNWILKQGENIVMMDDDIKAVTMWNNRKLVFLDRLHFNEFIETAFIMTEDAGLKMWGVNCVTDKGAYREYTPINFLNYISATLCGHRSTDLFYDETFSLKEDYDLSLQHFYKYNGALRFNNISYIVDHNKLTGGCSTYRNLNREKEQLFKLMEKWGKDVVTIDHNSRRSFDFNPILKVPLRGV